MHREGKWRCFQCFVFSREELHVFVQFADYLTLVCQVFIDPLLRHPDWHFIELVRQRKRRCFCIGLPIKTSELTYLIFSGTFERTEASQLCSNIDNNTAPHLHSATKHLKDSMPLRTPKHRLVKALVGFSLTCFTAIHVSKKMACDRISKSRTVWSIHCTLY